MTWQLGDGASDAMLGFEDEMEDLFLYGDGYNGAGSSMISTERHYPAPSKQEKTPPKPEAKYACRGCCESVLGKHLSVEDYCPTCQVFRNHCVAITGGAG